MGLDGPGSSIGNLSLTYTPYWSPQFTRRYARARQRRIRQPDESAKTARLQRRRQRRLRFRARSGSAEADRASPSRARADRPDPDHSISTAAAPDDRARASAATRPYRRDDRAGRISLESGARRLAILARARFQFARPAGQPVRSSIAGGDFDRDPFPRGDGQGRGKRAYEGIATLSRPLAPMSICRSRAAPSVHARPRRRRSTARKFFRPKGSSPSAGGRPGLGRRA